MILKNCNTENGNVMLELNIDWNAGVVTFTVKYYDHRQQISDKEVFSADKLREANALFEALSEKLSA